MSTYMKGMKRVLKITLSVLLVYLLFWAVVAAYFTYADRFKSTLEANLSTVFKRSVTIQDVQTTWNGLEPRVKISDLKVVGDFNGEPAFAFESLSASIDPWSVLRLWPRFAELEVRKPLVEVVSLDNNELQIAGLKLRGSGRGNKLSKRMISWLLDHQKVSWQDGEIVWRRDIGDTQNFNNIAMTFERQRQNRKLFAEITTPKGQLAFIATANGDLIYDPNWDASLEVQGEDGERLLKPDEFSVTVNDGKGRVLLKTLDVERIRDFVKLTGLAASSGWLLDANLEGRLHDVHFDFSGPLVDIETWSLDASASDIGFRSVGRAPAMNNLSGELKASIDGGTFIFATRNAEFSWARWYDQVFPINRAMGEFSWQIANDGGIEIKLQNGEFEDINAKISDINMSVMVDPIARNVSSFGQLFKVDSVADLRFEDGRLVDDDASALRQAPLMVDAKANFEVTDMSKLVGYIPNVKGVDKFRSWSSKAFLSGRVFNGVMSYKGEATREAFAQGKATLDATADFENVIVDYAPKQNWPAAERGRGKASIKNELLTISPDEIWLNGDPVTDASLKISPLFQRSRLLDVKGKTTTSLIKGVDFLFKGPLIKPENQLEELPILAKEGWVDIAVDVTIPLNNVNSAKVRGTGELRDGLGLLPEGVPVSDINGSVIFTERSVSSENIRAKFLGGETSARLVTLEEAQPPLMQLTATGVADTNELQPWVGEHLLTWFKGKAPWQGAMLIDNGDVSITGESTLEGIAVTAPAPLAKAAVTSSRLSLSMQVGNKDVQQALTINYQDNMQARFKANKRGSNSGQTPSLFDNSLISIGTDSAAPLKQGVNFLVEEDQVDLDDWLSAVIELASYQAKNTSNNTDFLDAMRSVNISAKDPTLLGRPMGPININAVSVDGLYWIGTLDGENVDGTLQMQPRDDVGHYGFKLAYLNLGEEPKNDEPIPPVDYSLTPDDFPSVDIQIDNFRLAGKNLGRLTLAAKPEGDAWKIDNFKLKHNGISTVATGGWKNNKEDGSMSDFEFTTTIDEAEGALTDMDFDGVIRKGQGEIKGKLSWIGAPHEFEYARLSGDVEVFIKDGELVKVEPGSGKLLGLLNFNAIARRLVFDFRDVFASGLRFDRMRYSAVLADGEAILKDAFILAPAVFVRMEGKVDLDKELIDMEVHVSPELGGNLALLSALANPAAGAVVFLTQRLFKDEMRKSSFKSYRALGTWEDFEMVEIKSGQNLSQLDEEVEEPTKDSDQPIRDEAQQNQGTAETEDAGEQSDGGDVSAQRVKLIELETIEVSPIPN